jgi:hypothetical protein
VSHLNAKAGVPAAQQYACGSGANKTKEARGNELVCFRLDGSYDTLIVAPIMTDFAAAGGRDDYSKLPKASVDVSGRYAVWTSNMGTDRMDAFIAKIPSQLLMRTTAPNPHGGAPGLMLMAVGGGALALASLAVVLANGSKCASGDRRRLSADGRR